MNQPTERARELLAQQRHDGDRRQDSLHERSEEELHQQNPTTTEAKARAAMAEQRKQTAHIDANLLERSEESVKSS
ncbi:hypothetical protein [Leptolyngbya iicbica]|uniref:Uncharacterized protein n=2 Tax=Cyanophyceae TaxID=3028117 RepID=A0A4Q7E4A1_9CYAN|nr:hypothetical protein [Leptolyngbya sp. LK]RZM74862.1 hypothetical protein DYY88_22765 [Leptolyngbya sp. LK]